MLSYEQIRPGVNRMTTYERHQTILHLLEERSSLKVSELAKMFEVSEGTIRNDLSTLAENNFLLRVRGGAIPKDGRNIYPIANDRAQINARQKKQIAR